MNIHLLLGDPMPLRAPSPAWQRYHARTAATHAVIERLDHWNGEHVIWTDIPGATDVFPDETELLRPLQGHWHAMLAGRLDSAREDGEDLRSDVVSAYRQTARDLPGLRRFLDRNADHPAINVAVRAQRRQVAISAGVASYDSPINEAVALGTALVETSFEQPVRPAPRRNSLFGLLRPSHP